jgi:flagellar biosynthesis/type III secretory pathway protein FliH
MSDVFVPLTIFLRPVSRDAPGDAPQAATEDPPPPAARATPDDYEQTLRAVRRFRAGLADALDAAVAQLLREIAREVLGRELALAPADVTAIVTQALGRAGALNVLSVRAHPDDVAGLAMVNVDRVADTALQRGDVIVELRSGTIDLTLGTRLENLLAARAA